MKYYVFVLGNPGDKYENTRHNAGWLVIDDAFSQLDWKRDSYAFAGVAEYDNFTFIKPVTFMNDSGKTVRYFLDKKQVTLDQCVVIYDDIDLPLGKMKISFDRGSGGHNGIKSIEQEIGSREFLRIRIGISKVLEDGNIVKPNVLGNFELDERRQLQEIAKKVRFALETLVSEGRAKMMTEFNSNDPHVKVPKDVNPE